MLLQKKGVSLKKVKTKTWVSLILLLLLLPIVLYSLFKPTSGEAAWFDDTYAYRQTITFTHNAALSDRRVSITVSNTNTLVSAGKMQSDCDDTRFTDNNGKVLKYQLVSGCNSATTVYDVIFPTVINGVNYAYIYYGNPSASSRSETVSSYTSLSPSGGSAAVATEEKGTGPVAYWAMDDAGGTSTKDGTASNNTGAITEASWKTPDNCVSGTCLYFDGSNDVVTVTNANPIDLDNSGGLSAGFTFEAWIKPNGAGEGSGGQIFYKGTNTWIRVDTLSGGLLDIQASVDLATTDATLNVASKVSDNRWSHVALTYTDDADDELTIWVNGVAVGSSTNGVGSLAADANNLLIGGNTTDNFMGSIDEFKIYSYEKTAAQIAAAFRSRGSSEGAAVSFGEDTKSPFSNGLTGYWPLDESTANTCSGGVNDSCDYSGNARDGAWNGNATSAAGKIGSAVTFDGAGDYVDLNAASLEVARAFTITAWIKPSDLTNSPMIVGSYSGSEFQFGINPSGQLDVYGGSTDALSTASSVVTGTWQHITLTYNGSGTYRFYVNGVDVTSTAAGDTLSSITTLTIGRWQTYYFIGQIDEVRFYNRMLPQSEITKLYNWAPAPVGYWKFDERTGTSVYDSSGNNNTGTIVDGGTAGSWQTGKIGATYNIAGHDGASDTITLASTTNASMGNTVSFWAKFNSFESGGNGSVVIGRGTAADQGYMFYIDSTSIYSRQATGSAVSVSNTLSLSTWYHIAVTRDGTTIKFYVNGTQLGSTQTLGANNTFNYDSISNFSGGANNFPVDGTLDDVRVYNYPRTQQQIIEDMNGGRSTGSSSILSTVSYWNMDEANGTTAHDSNSANANALTLSTSSWNLSGKTNVAWNGLGTNWLSRADDDDFDFVAADNLSISLWFKSDSTSNPGATEYLVDKSLSGAVQAAGYAIYVKTTGVVCFGVDDDTTWTSDDEACSTSDVYDNTWHHIVATKTGTTEIRMYVDGMSVGSDTSIAATGTLANSKIFYVGDRDGVDNGDEFNGDIDEVKMYRDVLTRDQVLFDMNAGSGINFGVTASTAEAGQLTDGAGNAPVLIWKLDEKSGTSATDTSGNGLDGTLTNTPTWTQGKYGSAVSFAGSDQHIVKSDDSTLDVSAGGSFTIETWFKHSTASSQEVILSKFNEAGYKIIMEADGDITCGIDYDSTWTPTDSVTSTAATYDDGLWHHIACVKNANTTLTLYIDGISVGTPDSTLTNSTLANSDPLYFGIDADGTSNDFTGQLDNLTFYNYVRASAQVSYDFNRGAPVGWWQFDECSGASAYDNSGNGNTGTITPGGAPNTSAGTCTSGTSSEMWYDGSAGRFNSALGFDATDDYVVVPSSSSVDLNNGILTLSAWVKWNGGGSSNYILDKASNKYNLSFSAGAGRPSLFIAGGTTISTSSAISSGVWHHIVGTYDGTTERLYVDGVFVTSVVDDIAISTGGSLYIGCYTTCTSSYSFDGLIDDVRIYNYALSSSQIQKLYNGGAGVYFGPTSGQP